tara:strand:+ start:111 stop:368 length:258 start_codon:yes stop_codon:yes gene_type:complete
MVDMKCNEDTINPSYIEKNNKRRPKHDPTNGKKRTEGSNEYGQTIRDTSQEYMPKRTKNTKNNTKIRIYLLDTLINLVLILNIIK